MICYKDRTFCPWLDCAETDTCYRRLTEEVRRDAEKWWGGDNAPIAVFINRPDCWKEKKNNV